MSTIYRQGLSRVYRNTQSTVILAETKIIYHKTPRGAYRRTQPQAQGVTAHTVMLIAQATAHNIAV